jgi:hypothetical protein
MAAPPGPPRGSLGERRDGVLAAEKHALDVHRLHTPPLFETEAGRRPELAENAGVVDKDVESAGLAPREVDRLRPIGLTRDILAAGQATQLRRQGGGVGKIGEDHLRAGRGEGPRRRSPDPARGAGDQRDATFQLRHSALAHCLSVVAKASHATSRLTNQALV